VYLTSLSRILCDYFSNSPRSTHPIPRVPAVQSMEKSEAAGFKIPGNTFEHDPVRNTSHRHAVSSSSSYTKGSTLIPSYHPASCHEPSLPVYPSSSISSSSSSWTAGMASPTPTPRSKAPHRVDLDRKLFRRTLALPHCALPKEQVHRIEKLPRRRIYAEGFATEPARRRNDIARRRAIEVPMHACIKADVEKSWGGMPIGKRLRM